MPTDNQFIRTELRYSGEEELKIIKDELSLSGAITIGEYDGMVEADLPVSSLEVLKKKHILMDFPSQKGLPENESAELQEITTAEQKTERSVVQSDWIFNFKKKSTRSYIDKKTNKLKTKGQSAEPGTGDDGDNVRESFPEISDGELETITIPENKSEEIPETAEEGLYIVIFNGPLNSAWRSAFNTHGIKLSSLFDAQNEYSYQAFLTKEQYDYLSVQDIIVSVRKFELEKKLTEPLIKDLSAADNQFESFTPLKKFDIVLADEKYLGKISETISTSGEATIIDSGLNIIRIETNPESPLLAALAGSPYISSLALYEPPTLYCDVCRKTVGLEYPDTATVFFGDAEIVGVIDSGIDQIHSDLKKRIKAALQYGSGVTNDQAGHGTHVAGIICGDGTASGGKIKGMAPKAEVVSLGIVNSKGELDLPVDIGRLLKIVADNGAKIINLSLGRKVSGDYQLGSFSVDKYVYENPEILVVVAAGNEGNAVNGKLAYKTVGAPATAKNVLTVGAATGRRTTPAINQTWGNLKPANFPLPPLNTVKLISLLDHPALGSSTGPTDFDSIKPEVIAPGTYILAAKATASNVSTSSSEFFDNNYTFKTGTSMATPVVTGIAALVREYLRTIHNYAAPSSSLLKAIIIGSSYKIDNNRAAPDDESLTKVGFPDFDQGFGLVNLSKLLNERTIGLTYADIFNTNEKALESRAPLGGLVKSSREYTFEITNSNQELSITLTWIDPPAKGVQNNLQLSVKPPSNEWKLGNMEHLYKKDATFDTLFDLKPLDKYNNTEKVVLKDPAPGKYLVRITAQNTLSKQGYSLAILGNISGFTER